MGSDSIPSAEGREPENDTTDGDPLTANSSDRTPDTTSDVHAGPDMGTPDDGPDTTGGSDLDDDGAPDGGRDVGDEPDPDGGPDVGVDGEGEPGDVAAANRRRLARRRLARIGRALRRRSRWRSTVGVILIAIIGVGLGLQLGARAEVEIGPFQMQVAAEPSLTGGSQLRIPPLGAISVASHKGPIRLVARVDGLNESETRQIIADPDRIDEASDLAASDVSSAVRTLAIRAIGSALLGALVLGAIAFRDVRRTLATGGVAVALLASSGGVAWATRDPDSLTQPRYEGLLTNVPALIGDAQSIYDNYGHYRAQLVQILTNMTKVYEAVSTLPTYQPDPNTIRAMHVSDLHNNPTAWRVIGTIGNQFQVNVIFDTGDLTDWGSAAEGKLYAGNIASLKVPYVFIRGNHDSADIAAAVAKNPNAVVLDNTVATVAGLTVAGIGSPRFTPDKTNGDDNEGESVEHTAGAKLGETVLQYDQGHERPVDIMMVHEPDTADPLTGKGPLVLAGHTHERKVKPLDRDTLLMIEGSTGAAGLRGLEGKEAKSFEMSVLYFSQQGALRAYDEITVSGSGQSQVELRRVIVDSQGTATPSATVSASPSGTVTVTPSPSQPPNTAPVVPAPPPTTSAAPSSSTSPTGVPSPPG